jgi:hypothetical protein
VHVLKVGQESFNQLQGPTKAEDKLALPWTTELQVQHLLHFPKRTSFMLGDMFTCDVSQATLVFIYSTCFGSFIHKIAHKLANEAPEGCLVTTTTYAMHHPGFQLVKHLPAKTAAWTDVFVYKRVGPGPWPELPQAAAYSPNLDEWEEKARALLSAVKV